MADAFTSSENPTEGHAKMYESLVRLHSQGSAFLSSTSFGGTFNNADHRTHASTSIGQEVQRSALITQGNLGKSSFLVYMSKN